MESPVLDLHDRPIETLQPAAYHALSREILGSDDSTLAKLNLSLLSSCSFSFIDSFLVVEAARKGIKANNWFGPFGQLEQPLLDADGEFWSHNPEVLLVFFRLEDCYPNTFPIPQRQSQETILECGRACIERMTAAVNMFRSQSVCPVLVANFAAPYAGVTSRLFDAGDIDGLVHQIGVINRELAVAANDMADVHIWDYAGLVSDRGRADWTDSRMWHLARQPIGPTQQPYVAAHMVQTLSAILQPPVKCLAVDFDNTLWGGVVGDDGLQGIQIGDDYPGSSFKEFQRLILALNERGILVAGVSKNDEAVAKSVFDDHPEMLIKWSDFAATRVNWGVKSENLKEIAIELNIGSDSIVFFDDSPVEREEVKMNAPDVKVVDVPRSTVHYVEALLNAGPFESPQRTAEDASRSRFYRDEKSRRQTRREFASMNDFLDSLEMSVEFGLFDSASSNRIAQLIQKTNQFNVTTRRHSQAKLTKMAQASDWEIRWIRLADRFGDSGLVGVTITQYQQGTAHIDSLTMSCRVMNRNVEFSMIHDLVDRARKKGCVSVIGEWIPTNRNGPVQELFLKAGFESIEPKSSDRQLFRLDISDDESFQKWSSSLTTVSNTPV